MSTLFSSKELTYLQDTDFLITKQKVTAKMQHLLEQTRKQLKSVVTATDFEFPAKTDLSLGKISKGEQYRQLPYLVLDYPKKFTQTDIFVFRTMFWWGNEFSCALLLTGQSWDACKETLLPQLQQTSGNDWYVCVNSTPWEHYFATDNYQKISGFSAKELAILFEKMSFLKISKRLSLAEWESLPDFAKNTFAEAINKLQTL